MAFVGANDGMLHAFKLGKTVTGPAGYVVSLKNPDGTAPTDIGKEEWAFIPQHALPYLKHLGNPSYKHLFYVDAPPVLVDISTGLVDKVCSQNSKIGCSQDSDCTPSNAGTCVAVTASNCSTMPTLDTSGCPRTYNKSWKTMLIGGMGLGAATRDPKVCSNDANKGCTKHSDCAPGSCNPTVCTDCVKSPESGKGYSSYFALDVTKPSTPTLFGEFGSPLLGFGTAGPLVLRFNYPSNNRTTNGKWYALLASGPTGPIDSITMQMKGFSDQPLRLFVIEVSTNTILRTFSNENVTALPGMPANTHTYVSTMPDNAFAGSLLGASIDTDKWTDSREGHYSDDAVYISYTRKGKAGDTPAATIGKFAKGGILRLLTGDSWDTSTWKVSTVIDGVGPITSGIGKLTDRNNIDMNGNAQTPALWLLFGTGRYFYKNGTTIDEDYTGQQEAIYGIKEPCYITSNANADNNKDLSDINCNTAVNMANIVDQTTNPAATIADNKAGWKVNLAVADGVKYAAQRVITTPQASSNGIVFFTSFLPYSSVCGYGGETTYWQLMYNTGDAPSANLVGKILHQSSNSFKEVNFSTAFTQSQGSAAINRQTGKLSGAPSGTGGGGGGANAGGGGVTENDPNSGGGGNIISNASHKPSKKILQIQEH